MYLEYLHVITCACIVTINANCNYDSTSNDDPVCGTRTVNICKCLVRPNIRKAETSTHSNRHENKSSAHINQLIGHRRWGCNHKLIIFKFISRIDIWSVSCETALRWMLHAPIDDKSTLVKVMAYCRQATSHCLTQCWPSCMTPYGVIWPQWVNK